VKYRLKDRLLADGVDLSGDAEFHETSGRIGLAWIPSAGMSAYINWGEGFLPPATEELANNPDQFGGFHKGLLPATSRGGEIGLRGTHGEQFYYDAALFLLNSANDFDRYRIAARPLETFYRNSGKSRRYGFEALVRWMPISALSLHAAYTWSLYRYTDPSALDGNRLPNSPEHQLALEAQYEIMPRLRIGCSAYMQSKWYVDKENSVPPVDGYALIGARIAYELKLFGLGAEVTLSGRNLADRKWIAFTEPDPDGNSYQPGPGRELFAGLRISF
jgi:iron complex outermembrane receptor protein